MIDLNSDTPVTPGLYTQYSTTVTAATTGNDYTLFAFREDPSYFGFDDASLTAVGSSTNLLTNPGFEGGTTASSQDDGLNLPDGWGTVYQLGAPPPAAGTVTDSSSYVHSGQSAWDDGSVGSFDGIFQVVNVTAGQQYNLTFWLVSPSAFETSSIEMAAYFGSCGSTGACVTTLGSGFVVQTPAPPVAAIGTTGGDVSADTFSLGSTAAQQNPVQFDGGILQMSGGSSANNIISAPVSIDANNGSIDTSTGNGGFSGVVSGPGSLTIGGGGVFSLTGDNTYTGGTIVNASTVAVGTSDALGTGMLTLNGGTLQAAVDGLAIANAATLAGTGTIDAQAFDLTYGGVIGGTGQLTKIGTGTLSLMAANTYTGGTALSAGTIALGNDAALGTGALTFGGGTLQAGTDGLTVANAMTLASNGTIDTQAFGLTASGVIGGTGQLTKVGSGTLTLMAANTYTGGTALNAGTIALGNDAALGTGALTFGGGTLQAATDGLTVANAMTLASNGTTDTQAFGLTASGVIGGTGQLTKIGSGTLTLMAANTYTGGTALNEGTIALGNGAALGTGALTFGGGTLQAGTDGLTVANAVTLASNGTIDTQAFGLTASGVIGGTGQLTKIGTGTLSLMAANTYTGGTTLNAGTLAIGNGAALGTGAVTVNGGALQAAADALALGNAITLSSTGTVDTQGFGLTISGVVSGAGQLAKVGGGTLALTGQNTFAGGTALNAGTIAVSDNASLGTGAATFSGGTLQAAADNLTLGNAAVLATFGTIDTQAFRMTQAGIVSGPGGLTKIGTGTLSLTGTNTFAGGTTLNAGTLAIGNDAALGTGSLTVGGGTLQAGADGLSVANAVTLAGNGTIDTQAYGLGVSGLLSGPGALTKIGTGTLSLTGTNTFAGGTTLNAGTLAIGNAGALGTGAVIFGGGTLQAGAEGLAVANAVTLASNGTIDTQDFGFTQAGVVSGPGGLSKIGAGTLSLTAANTFAGGTALNAGTLAIGNDAALGTGPLTFGGGTLRAGVDGLAIGNTVILASGGTVDTQGDGLTLGGTIDGPGALTKRGAGTLTLTGANSYAGGTLLDTGTIAIGSDTALGSGALTMADGTTLHFTAPGLTLANAIVFSGTGDPTIDTGSGTQTISGPITGTSSLTKTGSGTLDLTGTDTYTGATEVAAGTLIVDGSIADSIVTVDNGAAFGGGGAIGGLVLQDGSVIAPGVRTLTIAGSLALSSGSTYVATINGDGTGSRLAIGGAATLGGAKLSLVSGTGLFGTSTRATLLTAAGGLSGTFGAVTPDTTLAFLDPTLTYAATSVDLTLTRNAATIPSLATTPNQSSVATAIAALGPGSALYNAVLGQTAAGARQAFDAASGLSHSSTERITTTTSRMITGVVVDRLWDVGGSGMSAQQAVEQFGSDSSLPALVRCYGPVPETPPAAPSHAYTAWGEAFGTFGHTDGGANSGSLDRSLGGFVLGIDTPLSGIGVDHWRAGVAGGYSDTTFTSRIDGGSGTVQSVFGSLYGGARYGAIDVRLGATVSGQQTDARRAVAFPGFLETETSSNGGMTVQGFGEVGYRIPVARFVFEPVIGAAILHVHQDGFRENGGVAALVATSSDSDLGSTTLGVRSEVAPLSSVPLLAHVFLGWQHLIGNVSPAQTLAFAAAPTNTFSVSGTPLDRNALAAEVALDYRQSAAMDLGLTYTGAVGSTAVDNSIKGRVEYRF